MKRSATLGLLAALLASGTTARAEGLLGSPASMVHQHAIAVEEQYTFLRTPLEVARLVSEGRLVAFAPDSNLVLAGVSFAYARPEVLAFARRLGRDYRDSTGAKLTITSLTRPATLQPRNAHKLSVHPAGMAVDFRVPKTPAERAFLERTLLGYERAGLLDVTRERTPAHYHVAVFAQPMFAYLARRDSLDAAAPRRVAATTATARDLARVPPRMSAHEVDESRLPLFFVSMLVMLGMATPLVHTPRSASSRD